MKKTSSKRLRKLDNDITNTLKKKILTKNDRKVLKYFKRKLEIFINNSSR